MAVFGAADAVDTVIETESAKIVGVQSTLFKLGYLALETPNLGFFLRKKLGPQLFVIDVPVPLVDLF